MLEIPAGSVKRKRWLFAVTLLIAALTLCGSWQISETERSVLVGMKVLLDSGKPKQAAQNFATYQKSRIFAVQERLGRTSDELFIFAGIANHESGKFDEALRLFDVASERITNRSQKARVLYNSASSAMATATQGSYTQAIESLIAACELERDYTEAKKKLQALLVQRAEQQNQQPSDQQGDDKRKPDLFGTPQKKGGPGDNPSIRH